MSPALYQLSYLANVVNECVLYQIQTEKVKCVAAVPFQTGEEPHGNRPATANER